MAESQAPYLYSPSALEEIESQLSIKRFARYMTRAGHRREHAMQLYLYNARLAKSLLFPLHVLEVVLRNGIDDVITSLYGENWYLDQHFRNMLSPQSNNSLQKTISRFKKPPRKDDLVSQLSLDFWSNLFRPEYDRHLWQTQMSQLFPNRTVTRSAFAIEISQINRLRNRIAHHEPILELNTSYDHHTILEIIGHRSMPTKSWVKAHSTVPQMLRTKPKSDTRPGPVMGDRSDPDLGRVAIGASIAELICLPFTFFVAVNDAGCDEAIFDRGDITDFLFLKQEGGIIDFSDHRVADLLCIQGSREKFVTFDDSESLHQLTSAFKKDVRFVGVTHADAPDRITGVIAKAHRRY